MNVRETETPLILEVRQALSLHPLHILNSVSGIIEAAKPDPLAWLPSRKQREVIDLSHLIGRLIGQPAHETTVLLAVFAELLDNADGDARQRCRREVAARRDALPQWLTQLSDVDVYRAVRRTHVLGDRDEVWIGSRLASGDEFTCGAFIDHDRHSAVTDAVVIPGAIDSAVRRIDERSTNPDIRFTDMSCADARAWLEHGLSRSPVFTDETDTWPACRTLLKWLADRLPEGGEGYQSPEWDVPALEGLCDKFFASDLGSPFDRRDYGELLESLLETGDPVRWGVTRIERVLDSSDHRASLRVMIHAPALLKAFIPFAHAQSGIRDELTMQALAAVDEIVQDALPRAG